jgi:hypothetical protein
MRTVTYDETLRLRAPRGLHAALQLAARQRHTTSAEWARQTLLQGLEAAGVRLRDGEVELSERDQRIDTRTRSAAV